MLEKSCTYSKLRQLNWKVKSFIYTLIFTVNEDKAIRRSLVKIYKNKLIVIEGSVYAPIPKSHYYHFPLLVQDFPYPNFRFSRSSKYPTMEPDVLFHLCVYHWFRKLAQLVGIDLFLDEFKATTLTYILNSTLFLFMGSCLWTIYSYAFDEKVICAAMLAYDLEVN